MALYNVEYRGAPFPEVRLKTALVIAPTASAALDDIAHLIRPEDRSAYRVNRIAVTGRKLLFSADEW